MTCVICLYVYVRGHQIMTYIICLYLYVCVCVWAREKESAIKRAGLCRVRELGCNHRPGLAQRKRRKNRITEALPSLVCSGPSSSAIKIQLCSLPFLPDFSRGVCQLCKPLDKWILYISFISLVGAYSSYSVLFTFRLDTLPLSLSFSTLPYHLSDCIPLPKSLSLSVSLSLCLCLCLSVSVSVSVSVCLSLCLCLSLSLSTTFFPSTTVCPSVSAPSPSSFSHCLRRYLTPAALAFSPLHGTSIT